MDKIALEDSLCDHVAEVAHHSAPHHDLRTKNHAHILPTLAGPSSVVEYQGFLAPSSAHALESCFVASEIIPEKSHGARRWVYLLIAAQTKGSSGIRRVGWGTARKGLGMLSQALGICSSHWNFSFSGHSVDFGNNEVALEGVAQA